MTSPTKSQPQRQSFAPSRPASRMAVPPSHPSAPGPKPLNTHAFKRASVGSARPLATRPLNTTQPWAPTPQRASPPFEPTGLLADTPFKTPASHFASDLDGGNDSYMRPDKRRLSVPPPRFSPELDGSDGDAYMHPHAGDKRTSPDRYSDERDSKRIRPDVSVYIPAPASTTLELSMLEQWSAAHPEVRQRARERWTKCTLEEWKQGAEEFGERFKQILKIATGDMMKRQEVYAECFGKVRERSALVAAREVELGHALEAIRRDGQSVISGGSDIDGDGEDGFEDGFEDGEVQEGKDGE